MRKRSVLGKVLATMTTHDARFYTVGVFQARTDADLDAAADALEPFGDVIDVDTQSREITLNVDAAFVSTRGDIEQLRKDAYQALTQVAAQVPLIARVGEPLNVTDAADMNADAIPLSDS